MKLRASSESVLGRARAWVRLLASLGLLREPLTDRHGRMHRR